MNQKPQNLNKDLNCRLLRYAAAAGAMTALATNSNAQINYSGVRDITLEQNNSLGLDIDGDGTDDFDFTLSSIVNGTMYTSYFWYYSTITRGQIQDVNSTYNNSWLRASYSGLNLVQALYGSFTVSTSNSGWNNNPMLMQIQSRYASIPVNFSSG